MMENSSQNSTNAFSLMMAGIKPEKMSTNKMDDKNSTKSEKMRVSFFKFLKKNSEDIINVEKDINTNETLKINTMDDYASEKCLNSRISETNISKSKTGIGDYFKRDKHTEQDLCKGNGTGILSEQLNIPTSNSPGLFVSDIGKISKVKKKNKLSKSNLNKTSEVIGVTKDLVETKFINSPDEKISLSNGLPVPSESLNFETVFKKCMLKADNRLDAISTTSKNQQDSTIRNPPKGKNVFDFMMSSRYKQDDIIKEMAEKEKENEQAIANIGSSAVKSGDTNKQVNFLQFLRNNSELRALNSSQECLPTIVVSPNSPTLKDPKGNTNAFTFLMDKSKAVKKEENKENNSGDEIFLPNKLSRNKTKLSKVRKRNTIDSSSSEDEDIFPIATERTGLSRNVHPVASYNESSTSENSSRKTTELQVLNNSNEIYCVAEKIKLDFVDESDDDLNLEKTFREEILECVKEVKKRKVGKSKKRAKSASNTPVRCVEDSPATKSKSKGLRKKSLSYPKSNSVSESSKIFNISEEKEIVENCDVEIFNISEEKEIVENCDIEIFNISEEKEIVENCEVEGVEPLNQLVPLMEDSDDEIFRPIRPELKEKIAPEIPKKTNGIMNYFTNLSQSKPKSESTLKKEIKMQKKKNKDGTETGSTVNNIKHNTLKAKKMKSSKSTEILSSTGTGIGKKLKDKVVNKMSDSEITNLMSSAKDRKKTLSTVTHIKNDSIAIVESDDERKSTSNIDKNDLVIEVEDTADKKTDTEMLSISNFANESVIEVEDTPDKKTDSEMLSISNSANASVNNISAELNSSMQDFVVENVALRRSSRSRRVTNIFGNPLDEDEDEETAVMNSKSPSKSLKRLKKQKSADKGNIPTDVKEKNKVPKKTSCQKSSLRTFRRKRKIESDDESSIEIILDSTEKNNGSPVKKKKRTKSNLKDVASTNPVFAKSIKRSKSSTDEPSIDEIIVDDDIEISEVIKKPKPKLASIFCSKSSEKVVVSLVSPSKLKAKNDFLFSGVPEEMKQQIEILKNLEEISDLWPPFPLFSHIQQKLDDDDTWSLEDPEILALQDVNIVDVAQDYVEDFDEYFASLPSKSKVTLQPNHIELSNPSINVSAMCHILSNIKASNQTIPILPLFKSYMERKKIAIETYKKRIRV